MSASERKKKWLKKIEVTKKKTYVKFNVGDFAWYIYNNQMRKGIISQKTETLGMSQIKYVITGLNFMESELHQTQQALMQTLKNEYIEYEEANKCEE